MLSIEREARRLVGILQSSSATEKALFFKRTVDSSRMELTETEGGLVQDSYILGRLAQHLEFPEPLKIVVSEVTRAAISGQLVVGLDTWRAIAKLAEEHSKLAKAA